MELFFFILLLLLLFLLGYAQLQKGVFRTPGNLTSQEEEDRNI
jgi:hypothetical protein